jgi:hypothetical protein
MNREVLRKKLLSTARASSPSDQVPYAFEKRIMARLSERPVFDLTAAWARGLWQAAAPCAILAIALGIWALSGTTAPATTATTATYDFAQHFENTMLAAVEETSEETW